MWRQHWYVAVTVDDTLGPGRHPALQPVTQTEALQVKEEVGTPAES